MYSTFENDLLAKKGLNKHCSVSKVCIETFKLIECVSKCVWGHLIVKLGGRVGHLNF